MPIDLIYKKERFSQDISYVVNAPIGSILIWSGTEDNVPEGWNICNGQNGTIDLSDKTALYIQKTGVTPSDYMTREDVEDMLDGAGSSLPPGGTIGQVLAKGSNEDGDVEWRDPVGGGEVYSIEETRVGTWIDGKPLYRRVIDGTTGNSIKVEKTMLSFGSVPIDYINLYGYVQNGTSGKIPINYRSTDSFYVATFYRAENINGIRCVAGSADLLGAKIVIVAEYTKTID